MAGVIISKLLNKKKSSFKYGKYVNLTDFKWLKVNLLKINVFVLLYVKFHKIFELFLH